MGEPRSPLTSLDNRSGKMLDYIVLLCQSTANVTVPPGYSRENAETV
jgi:hypothetical protein